ncbi:putative Protein FAM92B [Hypsibius exemplaris]|uniref:Protein FAM92A1 n=1 Tax=Hypsibius exemplaris TaxID=2072580 RepID=A0A1W0WCU9_HYPEX|nr:putative Protein FAM92B [Hypsibius exemplaris]
MSERSSSPSTAAPAATAEVSPHNNVYDPAALEFQSKIINGHTQNTGVFFGRFCSGFAAYSRNLGAIRDQGDEIARSFAQYSETQAHSPVTKKQLTEFSGHLAAVQDHMHARILRLENKVVMGFSKYGAMCHVLKGEVEKGVSIRDREQKYQDDLQRMQVKLKDDRDSTVRQQKLDFAAVAASDAQRAHDLLLREADKFEQQKLEDMRRLLMNFCEIELAFHAKALKLYTQAYRSAKKLDMVDDIANFRTQMNIVRGSSSVGPDPDLILENCKEGCQPPETSSESELSSDSLSDGDGGDRVKKPERRLPSKAAEEKERKVSKLATPPKDGMRSSFLGGGGMRGSTITGAGGMRGSTTTGGGKRNSALVEKFSREFLAPKPRKSRKTNQQESINMPHHHRYTTMTTGACADHFQEYEKAFVRRRSLRR